MEGKPIDINDFASLAAIIASGISIYVTLYVKSCLGPIEARTASHEKRHDRQDKENGRIWQELGGISTRIARIEGRGGSNGNEQRSNK